MTLQPTSNLTFHTFSPHPQVPLSSSTHTGFPPAVMCFFNQGEVFDTPQKTGTTVKKYLQETAGKVGIVMPKSGGKTRLLNYELKVLSVQVVHVM